MLAVGMSDVELAIAVVSHGAAVVRRRFGTALGRIDKGAGDFATTADLEAEAAMVTVLRADRPDDLILGEESGRSGPSDAARRWLLDPLCGTLNYAAGMQVVAVNAALMADGAVTVAAVADPFSEEVFWTDGRSAYVRIASSNERLCPIASSNLVDLNLDPPFPNAASFRAVTLAADEGFVAAFRPRVVSSSLAMTWVATGQRAAYITDGDVGRSVHFAAGLAICKAAGCVISDLHGKTFEDGPHGLIVAADQETHASLVRLLYKQHA
jgi:myo-inositol-1(or 4)-monophosphatase